MDLEDESSSSVPSRKSRSKSATSSAEEDKNAKKRAYNKAYRSSSANKLKDAQRKKEQRAQMSSEEKEKQRQKDRERKAKSKKIQVIDAPKERETSELASWWQKEKKDKAEMRKDRTVAEAEFETLQSCIRKRSQRRKRTDDDHQLENSLARKGMRQCRQIGYIKEFKRRHPREFDDETLWYMFWCKGIEHRNILRSKLPDLVQTFIKREEDEKADMERERKELEERNVKEREEKEKKEKEMEDKRKAGFWDYNQCDDCYYWTGDGPSPISFEEYNGLGEYAPIDLKKYYAEMSPEEREKKRKEDEEWNELQLKWYREQLEEDKQERNRKQKEKRAKLKAELSKPIEMENTEEKISEYEQIRLDNLREIEEWKKASGLFN